MDETRERIIEAGIQLMLETGDLRKVTMRDIAKRAGVGLGLINYHFQSKDELMRLAIRVFMNRVIGDWARTGADPRSSDPEAGLRAKLSEVCEFLAAHPRISRISILFDLENPSPDDNSALAISSLIPAIAPLLGGGSEGPGDSPAAGMAEMVVGAMQHVFLRSPEGRKFFDAEWRRAWIEGIVRLVAGRGEPARRKRP
jgi:AcrR family transcriptional regulator